MRLNWGKERGFVFKGDKDNDEGEEIRVIWRPRKLCRHGFPAEERADGALPVTE